MIVQWVEQASSNPRVSAAIPSSVRLPVEAYLYKTPKPRTSVIMYCNNNFPKRIIIITI